MRQTLAEREVGSKPGFRLRGREVSRIEGFSDAVFGFALTLLVVSLDVPDTFGELLDAMRGSLVFGVCFYMLAQVWFHHYVFFRRYGLQDTSTLCLNALLLFVVLLYVYPLKFVFSAFFEELGLAPRGGRLAGGAASLRIEVADLGLMFVIYGAGFAAVFLILALLYRHAGGLADELELSQLERFDTRSEMRRFALLSGVGLLSVGLAVSLPRGLAPLAGFSYFLIGLVEWVHGTASSRRRLLLASSRRAEGEV